MVLGSEQSLMAIVEGLIHDVCLNLIISKNFEVGKKYAHMIAVY